VSTIASRKEKRVATAAMPRARIEAAVREKPGARAS
jgi:hypothetical protein